MSTGTLFDIRRHALHDGPGIRSTVFLKGCPLRCRWCHNPEGLKFEPEPVFRPERCLGCGACVKACPTGAIQDPRLRADPSRCTGCGACAEVCPSTARSMAGRRIEARELLALLRKDEAFYLESGGGITFSGGEPLSQPAFLLECLELCAEAGLDAVVDSSGQGARKDLLRAAELGASFLYDLKQLDSREHEALTGLPNGSILGNLEALAATGARITVSLPLIPGLNDGRENLEATAALLRRLGIRQLRILPYHDSARGKYALRGEAYPAEGIRIPLAEESAAAAALFSQAGLDVAIGGLS